MPDLPRALAALKRMAWLLDEASGHFAPMALLAGRDNRGRYERLTNAYQDALTQAYQSWAKQALKGLSGNTDEQKAQIEAASAGLLAALQQVGQERLPYAVTAIGAEAYMPSPDAWRMIAEAMDSQARDITTRLVPDVIAKLERGVDEGSDLGAVADSLLPQVSFYAGNLWVVIQRLVGDFATQATTRDDLIYPCRCVLDPQAQHCDSCPAFAGEYPSYDAMLEATGQCVPGYFVGSPYKKSCWLNCRCHIELQINGEWTKV